MCIVVLSIIFILLLACPISLPKGRALIIEELRLVLLYLILIFLLSYILSFSWFPFFCCSSVFLWTSNAGSREKKKKEKICPLTNIVLCVLFFFLFLRRQRERERERVRKCEKERERKRDTKRSVIEVISYYQYYRIIRLMLSLLFYYYYDYYY